MSKFRYNFIKSHGLDISHEFSQKNNPMSEFVTSILIKNPNLKIKELLISASNSYTNNKNFLDKNFVTKCEMYRSGKKDFKYEDDRKGDDRKGDDRKGEDDKQKKDKDDKKDSKGDKDNKEDKIKEDSKKMLEGKGREDFITGGHTDLKGGRDFIDGGSNRLEGGKLPDNATTPPKTIQPYSDTI